MLSNFLSRRWDSQQQQRQQQQQQQQQQQGLPAPRLADVPPTFVLCTLLPAAGQAHMWRGEAGCELQGQVAAWVARYVAAQQPQQAQRLLLELLDHLAASGSSVQPQRPLAQTFARALAAGAEAAAFVCEQQPAGSSSSSGSSQPQWQWQLRFLEGMQRATASLGSSWGGGSSGYSFALDISTHLLGAAAAVVQLPAGAIGPGSQAQLLAAGGAWLKQLLLAAVLPGGALHLKAAAWVRQLAGEQPAQLLATCVRHHMAPPAVGASSAAAVPDWEGWQQQAGGLARLALLLTAGGDEAAPAPTLAPADLTTAFSSWSDTLCMLYRRWGLWPGSVAWKRQGTLHTGMVKLHQELEHTACRVSQCLLQALHSCTAASTSLLYHPPQALPGGWHSRALPVSVERAAGCVPRSRGTHASSGSSS